MKIAQRHLSFPQVVVLLREWKKVLKSRVCDDEDATSFKGNDEEPSPDAKGMILLILTGFASRTVASPRLIALPQVTKINCVNF